MADQPDLFFGSDCGKTWTTNHNKAAAHGLVSQPITALPLSTLLGNYWLLDLRWLRPCGLQTMRKKC